MRAAASVLAVTLLAAASAAADPHRASGVGRLTGAHVLLLPVEVNAYELAYGGANSIRAERTERAREWVKAALERLLAGDRAVVARYVAPADPERNEQHVQVLGLYKLVRFAMISHLYHDQSYLPSVGERFEWTLGPAAKTLQEDNSSSRYGLFVEILEREMLGGALATFGELGRDRLLAAATIVDLTTGDALWLNYERGGSLATAEDATSVVTRLLRDLPF